MYTVSVVGSIVPRLVGTAIQYIFFKFVPEPLELSRS